MTGDPNVAREPTRSTRWRLPAIPLWLALVLMVAALALAVLILTRVAEPLYGLVFSSGVPVPEGAVEIERADPERGAAYRIYRTDQPGREVAAFYEGEGGACVYTAVPLAGTVETPQREHSVARCTGQADNAARGSGWEVFIAEGYSAEEGPTNYRLYEY